MHPEALPVRIGRYRILSELGRGMMGVVYKAEDTLLGRTVALKVIRLVFPVTDEQREAFEQRFVDEARIVAQLSHPNIVVAYDVGREGAHGSPYMALEYLVGRTLSQVLQEGPPLSWQDSLRVVARVAEALHYAHARGVVHRDVKPANVMLLQSGEPKLMDFGLAKLPARYELTASGQLMGTPLYMSPEQANGTPVDGRSDLFSLGSVLYTLLTGTRAFEAESVPRILNRVTYDEPPLPSRLAPDLPSALDYVLVRALSKPPDARYPDGQSLAEDLQDVLASRLPRHRARWAPPPLPEQTLAAALAAASAPAAAYDQDGARGAAQRAVLGRDETAEAPATPARPRRRAPLALLVASMLAFGLALYSSAFWRERLAHWMGVLPAGAPQPTPAAAGLPPATLATPAAAPEPSPEAPVSPPASAEPGPEEADAAEPTPAPVASGTPAAAPQAPEASPSATPAPAATPSAAPSPRPSPTPKPRPTARPTPRPTAKPKPASAARPARLGISLSHDLKSGRLKVDVDGETVCDVALRARQKTYLLVLTRREATLDRTLALDPGEHRIRLEVSSGKRKESKELVERFRAGETRQFDLRVSSDENGFRFEWE